MLTNSTTSSRATMWKKSAARHEVAKATQSEGLVRWWPHTVERMTTNTTTKTTAARQGSPTKKTTAKKPAAKSTATLAAKKTPPMTDAQTAKLIKLQTAATAATSAFEKNVVELLSAGKSPTHIAAALDIAGSSVRRVGFRHGVGTPPPPYVRKS
jgi:ATP/maltotriose-dependent transcriptional regulator MalT